MSPTQHCLASPQSDPSQHGLAALQESCSFSQVVQWSGLMDGLVVCPNVHVSALVVPGTQSHSD
jgi:hypothetical protein